VVDQAVLFGHLKKVRDLGIPLLSVIRVKPDPSTPSTCLWASPLGTGQVDGSDLKR
jgi:hypothetical protein